MAYFYLSFLGELFRCSMGEMEKNRNMEEMPSTGDGAIYR